MIRQFWRHKDSGDVWAVEVASREGEVVAVAGTLHHSIYDPPSGQVDIALIDDLAWDSDPATLDHFQQKWDEFIKTDFANLTR